MTIASRKENEKYSPIFTCYQHHSSNLKSCILQLFYYLVAQSCLSVLLFCDPMNGSLSSSSVHQVSQMRILEWVAILHGISLMQGLNLHLLLVWRVLYHYATCEAHISWHLSPKFIRPPSALQNRDKCAQFKNKTEKQNHSHFAARGVAHHMPPEGVRWDLTTQVMKPSALSFLLI